MQELTPNRIDRHTPDDRVDVNRPGPAACREHDGVAEPASPDRFRPSMWPSDSTDPRDTAVFDELRAVPARRRRRRARQLAGRHEPVRANQQPADDIGRQARFFQPHRPSVQDLGVDLLPAQHVGRRPQLAACSDSSVATVECPGPSVRDRHGALRGDAGDEVVVEVEATDREVEEGAVARGLDVRREHPGRRLRRAHADRALVDDLDRRAAPRQLVGDGAPDDAGADDDDV